ncbi:MAG: MBL fold metallo-hydrolase, partial [Bdellovibrionota bacterium]
LNSDAAIREPKEIRWRFLVSEPPIAWSGASDSVLRPLERARLQLLLDLESRDRHGILRKLVLNAKIQALPDSLLRHLGFVHLFTETGIHLYALIALLHWCALKILPLFFKNPPPWTFQLVRLLCLGLGFWCWALAGFRPGFVRPGVILLIRAGFRLSGLKPRFFALPLALGIACDFAIGWTTQWLDPTSEEWAPGRIHYTLAVAGGLWGLDLFNRRFVNPSPLRTIPMLAGQHASMSVASWLATAAWDLFSENWVATATPLYSLITIPIFAEFVLPAVLLGQFLTALGLRPEGLWLFGLAGSVANGLVEKCVAFQSYLPGLQYAVPLWASGGALLIVLVAIGFCGRMRWPVVTGIFGCLFVVRTSLLLLPIKSTSHPGDASERVELLDVGQGEAILVQGADGRTGLIDAGSARALSDGAWIALLAERGVTRIDWVLMSHLDEDHAGGLLRLSSLLPVGCVRLSQALLLSERGREWISRLDPVSVTDVAALETDRGRCIPFPTWSEKIPPGQDPSRNRAMTAVLIPLRDDRGYFFTAGDAGGETEIAGAQWAAAEIAARGLKDAPTRIHKLNHHGSRFSSSKEVLRAINPTETWVSAGVGNTYGHPSFRTLTRVALTLPGLSASRRTDQTGAIRWKAGAKMEVQKKPPAPE